jgi:hypothetical protein
MFITQQRPNPPDSSVGMVGKRKPQKTRYQGVAYVIWGNSYRSFGSPGSGLCVSAPIIKT